MSSREFTEWLVYDSINPIGYTKEEFLTNKLIAVILNIVRDSKKKAVSPLDVTEDWFNDKVEEKARNHIDLLKTIYSIHIALGGDPEAIDIDKMAKAA